MTIPDATIIPRDRTRTAGPETTGTGAGSAVRTFIAVIAQAFDGHEFLAGAILFGILALLTSIGSLAVAFGIAIPCALGCIAVDRWTAMQKAKNAERDQATIEWGEADFERLVAELSLVATTMRSADEQPERRAA